jgi:hypothetical protein
MGPATPSNTRKLSTINVVRINAGTTAREIWYVAHWRIEKFTAIDAAQRTIRTDATI